MLSLLRRAAACGALVCLSSLATLAHADHVKRLQTRAIEQRRADWGHWGVNPDIYSNWTTHSNRLIPVYTYGVKLDAFQGENSLYRNAASIERLYGRVPEGTLNPQAQYLDQTDIYRLQHQAAAAGKKYIVLIVFDGMDWQTTQAAAIYYSGEAGYREGRGHGLYWQDYRGVETDFGFCVTAPHNNGTDVDTDSQTVTNPGGLTRGGYDWRRAGPDAWTPGDDPRYTIGKSPGQTQPYTDSAASATSLTAGVKTYNNAINVDAQGRQVVPIARELQQQGFAIGVVTSVPISHATPAAAYANNVARYDYQDLSRDLLGLPSVAHREDPLPGVDVLIGGGFGEIKRSDPKQGKNFEPGNRYLTSEDLERIDVAHGGRYRVAQRAAGVSGAKALADAASLAAEKHERLLGFFGLPNGHLPFRTADGQYDPAPGVKRAEHYSPADLNENPTLAQMTSAALKALSANPRGFWLMIEAGDVDWANHDNNIDNSIGAVKSGDDAFRVVAQWAEQHDRWRDTAVILTADHGHYFMLTDPAALLAAPATR